MIRYFKVNGAPFIHRRDLSCFLDVTSDQHTSSQGKLQIVYIESAMYLQPMKLVLITLASFFVIASGFLNPSPFFKHFTRTCQHATFTKKHPGVLFQTRTEEDNGDEDLFRSIDERKDQDGYLGAGVPRASLGPEEIVPLLMKALENNDFPEVDAGLVSVWEFSSDITKFIFKNNMTGKKVGHENMCTAALS